MASPKKSGNTTASTKNKNTVHPKKTSIGCSKNTHFKSKNDKRNRKAYRGQGK